MFERLKSILGLNQKPIKLPFGLSREDKRAFIAYGEHLERKAVLLKQAEQIFDYCVGEAKAPHLFRKADDLQDYMTFEHLKYPDRLEFSEHVIKFIYTDCSINVESDGYYYVVVNEAGMLLCSVYFTLDTFLKPVIDKLKC